MDIELLKMFFKEQLQLLQTHDASVPWGRKWDLEEKQDNGHLAPQIRLHCATSSEYKLSPCRGRIWQGHWLVLYNQTHLLCRASLILWVCFWHLLAWPHKPSWYLNFLFWGYREGSIKQWCFRACDVSLIWENAVGSPWNLKDPSTSI